MSVSRKWGKRQVVAVVILDAKVVRGMLWKWEKHQSIRERRLLIYPNLRIHLTFH